MALTVVYVPYWLDSPCASGCSRWRSASPRWSRPPPLPRRALVRPSVRVNLGWALLVSKQGLQISRPSTYECVHLRPCASLPSTLVVHLRQCASGCARWRSASRRWSPRPPLPRRVLVRLRNLALFEQLLFFFFITRTPRVE